MNVWGVLQQIQALLQAAVWPGGATTVFHPDSVIVLTSEDVMPEFFESLIPPLAVICPMSAQCDPEFNEEPTLIKRSVDIVLVQVNQSDRFGQNVIMGGQSPGTTQSQGRGLLELEEILFSYLAKLDSQQGITIQFTGSSAVPTQRDTSDNFVGMQRYTFDVWTTTSLT
jgi:hypothetical protein